jgi:GNAT superfamily N-acetyltransferase
MADYPAHLVRERRLGDGRTVTLRPIRTDDAGLVHAFLDELSAESRYMRFHKWVRAPSDRLVHFLTDVDYDRHMALVCTARRADRDIVVGEARYVADPDGKRCELGIVIADAWRKSGIAGLLMECLIRAARARGLETMEGLVLAHNAEMLRFVRALGFEVRPEPGDRTTMRIAKKLRRSRSAGVT